MSDYEIVDSSFTAIINAPLDTAAQRQPMSIAHNKGETPLFAASIERAALKN
ncbi:hypothetical protein QO004_003030 [Rhizobium mesoamericanum]|uniref:hypothetical protein n=1 Tax=Rhizobium mesoamericanum TaxID=1079800 RepID=UPI002786A854|nr:hypothetical protein [Rhizobium mesoamericanum]MDQ0561237.1 hypothetical protein [Rhizobium mesoamericanum]